MAYRQTRPLPLALTEIDANRLALRRDRIAGVDHKAAIDAAAHMAALSRESARLLNFVRGV